MFCGIYCIGMVYFEYVIARVWPNRQQKCMICRIECIEIDMTLVAVAFHGLAHGGVLSRVLALCFEEQID